MGRAKIPIDEKICPGCGELNPRTSSYCLKCMSAVQSVRLNGWAHYNDIEHYERKEVMKFVDKIRNQNGFLTFLDMFLVIHYYQLTHKLVLKYNHYTTERQIWFFFIDLLIWSSKQKGQNMTFNKMRRQDIYKILMKRYAT